MTVAALVVLLVVSTVAALHAFGSVRWNVGTRALRARLDAAREPVRPVRIDFRELDGLPAPVQRYFRTVLEAARPTVSGVVVRHRGTFNTSTTGERWRPFISDQRVVIRRPGFDWDARIAMLPGLPVRVHDAYIAGEGILRASLLGLVPVAATADAGELARGELMRFLAEAAWYPTALLPSQGVRWQAVDDHSARGTLVDGASSVTMLFAFNERDLIESVRADARGRIVGTAIVPTPWQGRFSNYAERDGMLVPHEGEVAWLLPDGEKPYWRGRIEGIRYEFAS